jgi:hypothetical protein
VRADLGLAEGGLRQLLARDRPPAPHPTPSRVCAHVLRVCVCSAHSQSVEDIVHIPQRIKVRRGGWARQQPSGVSRLDALITMRALASAPPPH